jgi:hypothetical protein
LATGGLRAARRGLPHLLDIFRALPDKTNVTPSTEGERLSLRAARNLRMISRTVTGDLSATCLSCNPTTINRRRETREFGVQPTMQAQPFEDYL